MQFDVEAWTLELGSAMQLKADAIEDGTKGIKNYLLRKGILNVEGIESATNTAMRLTESLG